MRYTIWALLVGLSILLARPVSTRCANVDSLTVDGAIALVIQNHPALEQAAHRIEAARARVGVSQSSFYPEITGRGIYNRIAPVPTVDIPGDGSFAMIPSNNWDLSLGINQLVYDFGKREKGVDLARSGVAAARDNEELIKSQLSYAAVNVFYSILYLQRDIVVIDEQIADLNKLLEETRERARTGSTTDFDVLTTQVRVSAAETRKVDSERRLNNQMTTLRRLTGWSDDRKLALAGDFSMPIVSLSADSLVEMALRRRQEMQLAQNAVKTATLQHELASLQGRPTLSVGIEQGFKTGYFPNLDDLRGNFVAGASVTVPIFTGFRTENQEKLTLAGMNEASARKMDVERQITAEVRQALEDVRADAERIRAAEIQVRHAEEALKMGEVRFKAGVITNLDLLDAHTSLSEARLADIGARYGYVVSRYALDRATGASVWAPQAE
jgi:outer membrane protein